MDTVEVTLRLDRSLAHRLRHPAERARYEAFLGLVPDAATQADVKEADQLLTAAPRIRQRRLKRAFDDLRQRAEAAGLTPEEVEHELAARKREWCATRSSLTQYAAMQLQITMDQDADIMVLGENDLPFGDSFSPHPTLPRARGRVGWGSPGSGLRSPK
jgi:hypothetical protein